MKPHHRDQVTAGLTRAADRQQPQLPCALHGRGAVTDPELGVDAAEVREPLGGPPVQHPALVRAASGVAPAAAGPRARRPSTPSCAQYRTGARGEPAGINKTLRRNCPVRRARASTPRSAHADPDVQGVPATMASWRCRSSSSGRSRPPCRGWIPTTGRAAAGLGRSSAGHRRTGPPVHGLAA